MGLLSRIFGKKKMKQEFKTIKGPFDEKFPARFVDLSHYEQCDFDKLDLKKLFITKCSEGIWTKDGVYESYKAECLKRKIPFGAYHFFRLNQDPIKQADWFLRCLGENAFPILDIENLEEKITYDQVEAIILPFLERVEQYTGKTPIVYTGHSFAVSCKFSQKMAKYPLWLARYCSFIPTAPAPWSDFWAWQYSDKGIVAGIGDCDNNYLKGEIWT